MTLSPPIQKPDRTRGRRGKRQTKRAIRCEVCGLTLRTAEGLAQHQKEMHT